MIRIWFPVLVGCLGLAACQTTSVQELDARVSQVESRIPASWETDIRQGEIPQDWTGLFDDPILAGYLNEADQANADIDRATIQLRQAEASIRQARSSLLPFIRANTQVSGVSALDDINLTESFGDSVSLSYDPGLFGRNRINIDRAKAVFDSQKAQKERLRRSIMAQVVRAYIQIIENDDQLVLARDNLSFLEETLRISKARFEAGDIARDELALAELSYENSLASVVNLDVSSRNLRRALAVLIGRNADVGLDVAPQLPAPRSDDMAILPADLLGRRYDIAASRAQLAVFLADVMQTERGNWPDLSFSGQIGGGGGSVSDLFEVDTYIASLGSTLSAVLFDNGLNAARIESAQAGLDAALTDYDATIREALLDLETSYDRMQANRTRLAALGRGSASADKALELEKIKYDLGESIILDVLNVQSRVNAIQSSYIRTQADMLNTQIDIFLALGGNTVGG